MKSGSFKSSSVFRLFEQTASGKSNQVKPVQAALFLLLVEKADTEIDCVYVQPETSSYSKLYCR